MAGDLVDGWSLLVTEPGAYGLPNDIPSDRETLPAIVPGTLAAALEGAGRFDRDDPEPLIDKDAWYCRSLADVAPGQALLRFEGLATIADVFLDDRLILSSASMFESHDVAVDLIGNETLSICFRALKPHLEKTGPRARWRPRLMNNQGLRLVRTTTLGFMPGWCPEVHAVGPWRPVSVRRSASPLSPASGESGWGTIPAFINRLEGVSFSALLADNGDGVLKVGFADDDPDRDLRLLCAGHETAFTFSGGRYSAELRLPGIAPWWPHTHGEATLYDVTLRVDGRDIPLARTGFRNVEVDRGTDGKDFAFLVNGERIFCRGAVWTSADIVGLAGDRQSYEPWLRLAKEAGMNMIRVPGIALYESPDFFALCDELGLMVWQDLMFANFDYPAADPDFLIHVKSEVDQFLARTSLNPSLAIICGGSEIWQQGAMLGLPERIWKGQLCAEILPTLVTNQRPDLPYAENSPCGGALPFYPNAGVAHYYGVGAYLRPLEDARRADIRFAAECLAFSNMSETERLDHGKSGIPRDAGADWDFEDVRDHYLGVLYGVDAKALRNADFERYLALSRAVTGEVMEAAFAEWRRPGSSCHGALTFTLQDVMKGPGWGVVGADGRPKPAWFALKRAFRPVQVVFADEGTNGLDVHVLNETAEARTLRLEVTCLRDGKMPVVSGRREIALAPRECETIACTDLFGAFFDANYAYRFGPPSHDVVVARLLDAGTDAVIAEAFHFPLGRDRAMHGVQLRANLGRDEDGWWLDVTADVFAQSVRIEAEGFQPADNWFHLAPGTARRIRLKPINDTVDAQPSGTVRSLGGSGPIVF
ncbi:glycoside hydrolase family 2 protein [Rhizobium sp. NFR07]|uniref:glycoside hydrolase family 2 protein n=1 Tax=Rhizobium sp. NFR07 TaxID=1566262 RepID=UPI000B84CF1E|nr:glycoside hydrolase family 2 protein [Rhizobium sp. NFR07]